MGRKKRSEEKRSEFSIATATTAKISRIHRNSVGTSTLRLILDKRVQRKERVNGDAPSSTWYWQTTRFPIARPCCRFAFTITTRQATCLSLSLSHSIISSHPCIRSVDKSKGATDTQYELPKLIQPLLLQS